MTASAVKDGKNGATLDTTALARLADEVVQQLQRGEQVDPAVLASRYPDHAEKLCELLPAIQALADLSQSGEGSGPLGEDSLEDSAGSPGNNRELGDFRIVRQIGRGGMGIVYEAEQISLRRRVALKILPLAGVLDQRHLARFKNESLAAAALQHPHIVPVYAVGCERGIHYYAMQYVVGQNLAELIRELRIREGLDEPQADPNDETPEIAQQLSSAHQADADHTSEVESQRSASQSTLISRKGSSTQRNRQEQAAYYRNIARLGLQAAKALATPTRKESSTGTSSLRTYSSTLTANCGSPILAWPAPSPMLG